MKPKIVGMLSSYKNLDQRDWLWQQTPHPFGVWGNIQMLSTAPKPDFLLLYQFNFHRQQAKSSKWQRWLKQKAADPDFTAFFREVPQERIVFLMREPPLETVVAQNKANYQRAAKYCSYVSGPDEFAPQPDYMPAIWYHANSFRELNEMEPPEKPGRCCWITSGIDRSPNHQRRLAFLKQLLESEIDFDLYGRRLPDWAHGYGSVNNKWHAIAPYYYNLAIENYADNQWYVSEKLWDALLGWCLPIYYGGSAADKLLPPGSFLRLPSLDEKGVAYIKEVTSSLDAWHEARVAISEARQIILHKLNLLEWLSSYVAQFS